MFRTAKYLIAAGLTLTLMVCLAFYFASILSPGVSLDCGKGVRLELVKVPAGKFTMGSPESEEGRNKDEIQHQVTISKSFHLGKYEVTQAQYQAVMGTNPSKFKGDNLPVETVSWEDAKEFCRKLSEKTGKAVRLPTEAEWEYACRAGTTTAYNPGGSLGDSQAKFNGDGGTMAVGSYKPNAWDLYDMHGNVWEWCSDWYGEYGGDSQDLKGPESGSTRVLRGGSWSNNPKDCRSANRLRNYPGIRGGGYGFRIVVD